MKIQSSLRFVAGFLFVLAAPALHAQSPVITCPAASTNECGVVSAVTVTVADTNGDNLTVVWSLNGASVETNDVAGTTSPAGTAVTFSEMLPVGDNTIEVSVSDPASNSVSCSTTVTVVDTTPPVIESVTANPDVLWPPNHQMRTIHLTVEAMDECGPTTWKILGVSSNEAENAHGSGHTAPDWKITGDHGLQLRAERAGPGHGRVYTITIQVSDLAGNTADATVTVTVPHDQGHGNSSGNGNHGNSSGNGNHGNSGGGSNNGHHHGP